MPRGCRWHSAGSWWRRRASWRCRSGSPALVCFPGAFRRVPPGDPARASALALIGRTIAIGLGLVVVYALSGASYLRPHHLFLLVLVPVWLIGRLDAARLRRWGAPAFAGLILLCCVAAAVGFSFETRRDAASCDTCEEFQPVEIYARALGSEGFVPGTILALSRRQDFPTAALLHFFPDARMVAWDYARYAPPPTGHRGDCLLVWSGAEERPEAWPPGAPVPGLGSPAPPDATIGLVTGRLPLSAGRRLGCATYW